jgi:GxxExxY protein
LKTLRQLKHADVTQRIIGVLYDVYNELGFGFLESVYEASMILALEQSGLNVSRPFLTMSEKRSVKIGANPWPRYC